MSICNKLLVDLTQFRNEHLFPFDDSDNFSSRIKAFMRELFNCFAVLTARSIHSSIVSGWREPPVIDFIEVTLSPETPTTTFAVLQISSSIDGSTMQRFPILQRVTRIGTELMSNLSQSSGSSDNTKSTFPPSRRALDTRGILRLYKAHLTANDIVS